MDRIEKAVWYIETHFGQDLSLDDVARFIGLSKFHLIRAFALRAGQPVVHYIRSRRLSEAAKQLVRADANILSIAFEAGYNSHAAFTRAFAAQFGVPPDTIKKARSTSKIELVEPIHMDKGNIALAEPRIVDCDELLVVGLKKQFYEGNSAGIPAQWQSFQPYIGHLENQKDLGVTYGILCNGEDDGNIEYIAGVAVTELSALPKELHGIRIPPQRYAVFEHSGHVAQIHRTWNAIFARSGLPLLDAPQFERYGDGFDPETGEGDITIWIPVSTRSISN